VQGGSPVFINEPEKKLRPAAAKPIDSLIRVTDGKHPTEWRERADQLVLGKVEILELIDEKPVNGLHNTAAQGFIILQPLDKKRDD
jgi:hypothetical protein